jgi:dolichol-phosphate mannosyltransferase
MEAAQSLDIVIPIFNEGDNIEENLRQLETALQELNLPVTLYLVYDFDSDDTLPVLERLKPCYPYPLKLIKNPQPGLVGALKSGIQAGNSELVLITMADLSDDYQSLPAMLKLAEQGYDLVCASRYLRGGRVITRAWLKPFLSRLAGWALHLLTRLPTCDPTNNYKLYRRKLLSAITIESRSGFELALELTVKAKLKGFKITEIPTFWKDRRSGASKFKLWRTLPQYLKWCFYLIFKSCSPKT